MKQVMSVESFLKELKLKSKEKDEKKTNNKEMSSFYRGQSDVKYDLNPSVFRGNMKMKEHEIYDEIMTECAYDFDQCKLHNEILSKMQHYGVPTRLLDVTTNALVALYFACQGNQGIDGAVYVMTVDKSEIRKYDSDTISILSSLPRFDNCDKERMLENAIEARENIEVKKLNKDSEINKFNSHEVIRKLLHEIKKEKPAFENIIDPNDLLEPRFFMPRKTNARIIKQSGAFVIFGLENKVLEKDSPFIRKIIIDHFSKGEITKQLLDLGITEATLHPELYKVSEYIKDKYK